MFDSFRTKLYPILNLILNKVWGLKIYIQSVC